MYRDPRTSVLRVLKRGGGTAGTAFFCLPKGYLVTCAHVIDAAADDEGQVQLQFFPGGATRPIDLEGTVCTQWSSSSSREDISVLKLKSDLPSTASPLSFDIGDPRVGTSLSTYGYSAHNPVNGMPGYGDFVGLTRELTSGTDVYVVRGDGIARGFSGAPCILAESGEVLGVVTALTTADLEGRWPLGAFVTPAKTVLRLCPVLTVGTPPVVQALIQPWHEQWEPFQKYVGSAEFQPACGATYQFPVLEEMPRAPLKQVLIPRKFDPIQLIGEQLISPEPKLLIIAGAPGTGKSRLLSEIARTVCQSGSDVRLDQLVPILVTARSFERAAGTSIAERLCESLRSDAALPTVRAIDAGAIDGLLFDGRYHCLIMIDGADEVSDSIRRKQLFKRVAADARALLAEGHAVVLSTRPLDESGSDWMTRNSLSFRLPLLDEQASASLAINTLGGEAENFKRIATSTGLMAFLDTPLLLNLAATLLLRGATKQFPSTVLEVFQQYLSEIRGGWHNAPAGPDQIIEILGGIALGSMNSSGGDDGNDVWLTEVDHALRDAFQTIQQTGESQADTSLRTAQTIVNFGLLASGLMYRRGESINWSHLLLRDYLAALKLQTLARTNVEKIGEMLSLRYELAVWREALILFVVAESIEGRAEPLLRKLRDRIGGYSTGLIAFIRDCIYRGAVFSEELLAELFSAFEERALLDQHNFDSCRSVFDADYGAFWHLLRLQRIPQAQAAIRRTVSRADMAGAMSEWPDSDRSKIFTPKSLYAGPLATAPAIFPKDELLT